MKNFIKTNTEGKLMGIQVKAGKFEATLPGLHTLPVSEVVGIMQAGTESQPYLLSQSIMKRLTWRQKQRFQSLSLEEFAEVCNQWLGNKNKAKSKTK